MRILGPLALVACIAAAPAHASGLELSRCFKFLPQGALLPGWVQAAQKHQNIPAKYWGIRNLVWVLAPWVFVAITFKEWILVLDG